MEEAASSMKAASTIEVIEEEVPHTKTPIILHYLIEANKTAKTLISISELSLYSWVFKITDPTTGNIYVIKIIPIGHNPPEGDSQDSFASTVVKVDERDKKITPTPERIEREFDYLTRFYDIGPHPESWGAHPGYDKIIDDLISITSDKATINVLQSIRKVLQHIKLGYIDVMLGWIVMEFIPGKTLQELKVFQKKGVFQKKAHLRPIRGVIDAMYKIIDLLFTKGFVLSDCHEDNVMISKSAATCTRLRDCHEDNDMISESAATCTRLSDCHEDNDMISESAATCTRDKTDREIVLESKEVKEIKAVLIDFSDAYKRTHIFYFYVGTPEMFKAKVIARAQFALWVNDEEGAENAHEIVIPLKSIELMEKLMDNNAPIELSEILPENNLLVVLCMIRETSNQYSWMEVFITEDELLSQLLAYLHQQNKRKAIQESKGGKRKTKRKSKSKTKRKSKNKYYKYIL